MLERLESYACYEVAQKILPVTGSFRLCGRDAHGGMAWANVEVTCIESLEGLEARRNGRCVTVLCDDHTLKQMTCYREHLLPQAFYYEPYQPVICPCMAVAYRQ